MTSRRNALQRAAALLGAAGLAAFFKPGEARAAKGRFQIGACDWSIGKRDDVGSLELGAKIGLDGIQVNMGGAANEMHLRRPEIQRAYLDAARKHRVRIGGLALGELNNVPYKSDDRTDAWVRDSISVAKALGVKVVLLAFFGKNDLRDDPAGQGVVIGKLKAVAPAAEKAGVILGIESYLSAADHLKIIEAVGSKNVQVYYDVRNSADMGYDIYQEIRWLGKQGQICEFHFKEYDALLGGGIVDFARVREAIDEIDYRGWVQIEGAVPKGGDIARSYVANNAFVRKTLG
ncbi:MAG: sugar phosphate isomerase/epimerase [Cytophagales bacterium]|nr:sugar phosphate isomerase/epimerase [Cytophagales bacterium]